MMLHPNVVVTYDCCTGLVDAKRLSKVATAGPGRSMARGGGRTRKMTVMVQEYCEGGTLKEAMTKGRYGLERWGMLHQMGQMSIIFLLTSTPPSLWLLHLLSLDADCMCLLLPGPLPSTRSAS
jgi:hypothetical protein